MKGKLFVISGPSGVGKDYLIDNLNLENNNLKKILTYTTRPKRATEKEDREYHFVSDSEFKQLIKNDKILEYNVFNDFYYGTPKEEIINTLKNQKNVLVNIDVNGGMKIKKIFPDSCIIFVKSSKEFIKSRLLKRNQNTEQQIKNRLETADQELAMQKHYDFVVENPEGHPERAINEIEKIIREEK